MSASVQQIDGRRTQTGHRRYNGEHTIYGAGEVIHVITIQSTVVARTTVAGQCEYSGFNWSTIGTQVVASRFMTRSGGKVKLSAALSFSLTQMTEPDTVTRRSDHTGYVS